MSREPTGMILHLLNEKVRERDSVPRRTDRLNLLNDLARRLEEWKSTLEGRNPMGPTLAEMDRIVKDLTVYWEMIENHRFPDDIAGDER